MFMYMCSLFTNNWSSAKERGTHQTHVQNQRGERHDSWYEVTTSVHQERHRGYLEEEDELSSERATEVTCPVGLSRSRQTGASAVTKKGTDGSYA